MGTHNHQYYQYPSKYQNRIAYRYMRKKEIIEKSYDKYLESLKEGNFQLFLGEIKLTENMDISHMVIPGGSAAFGIKSATNTKVEGVAEQTASISDVVNGFYNGNTSILDIETTLQTEMPFIPICYRTGVLFCNEKISVDFDFIGCKDETELKNNLLGLGRFVHESHITLGIGIHFFSLLGSDPGIAVLLFSKQGLAQFFSGHMYLSF